MKKTLVYTSVSQEGGKPESEKQEMMSPVGPGPRAIPQFHDEVG